MASNYPEIAKLRSAGPDQLKAILLFFVIFFHTIAEAGPDDLTKWLVFGFIMPVFLFLSGYLIDAGRLLQRRWGDLVRHYWARMLAAWLAVAFVFVWFYSPEAYASVAGVLEAVFVTPAFHLWYVPALLIGILLARALAGSPGGRIALVAIAVAGFVLLRTPLVHEWLDSDVNRYIDSRLVGYLPWFVFGLAVRNGWTGLPPVWLRVTLAVAGAAVYTYAFWGGSWWTSAGVVLWNLGLCSLLPAAQRALERPLPAVGHALARIGEHSLWVYLLHPFITLPLQLHGQPIPLERALGVAVTISVLVLAYVVIDLADRKLGRSRRRPPHGGAATG